MRALLASPLGFLIGLSLGALGGGGSILAVPALVYAAGQSPKEATTTSLVLVAMTAVIGILPHWRAGRVRLVPGLLFGLAGIGGSLLGSHWNRSVDQDVLLLAFSGVMLVAGWAMWRRNREAPAPAPRPVGAAVAVTHVALDLPTVAKGAGRRQLRRPAHGFFGVGGGFVIVPALVLALRFSMPEAVGTSLLVITINAVIALGSRLDAGAIDWGTVIPFTIASLGGVVVGGRLAGQVDARKLTRWFVWLLVAVAVYTAVRSIIALT
ncbi:MAG: sulfite exporter TauE/SafE family protein [Ilumatobacteraceae bacterium]